VKESEYDTSGFFVSFFFFLLTNPCFYDLLRFLTKSVTVVVADIYFRSFLITCIPI